MIYFYFCKIFDTKHLKAKNLTLLKMKIISYLNEYG